MKNVEHKLTVQDIPSQAGRLAVATLLAVPLLAIVVQITAIAQQKKPSAARAVWFGSDTASQRK